MLLFAKYLLQAKYENNFKTDKSDTSIKKSEKESDIYMGDALKEKDLEAALDSFDNLFCRRCLVYIPIHHYMLML